MLHQCHVIGVLVGVLLACGCSGSDLPALGTVTGTITVDGAPVKGLRVAFQPEAGRGSAGFTDAQGTYHLKYLKNVPGAIQGKHTVSVTYAGGEADREGTGDPTGDASDAAGWVAIPARYNSKTTLTADVKPGKNTIGFSLHLK